MSTILKFTHWEFYQHYKDRDPPWIKLHVSILSSSAWVRLDNCGRVLAIACMVIASKNKGQFEADAQYLKRVAYLDFEPDFNALVTCGLCEIVSQNKTETEERQRRGEESIVQADASKLLASASKDVQVTAWKPLEAGASIQDCVSFLMAGHTLFSKMPFAGQAQVASLLNEYADEERVKACNRIIQDYAGDAEMKYPPAMQLRYALEDIRNPRKKDGEPTQRKVKVL